MHALLSAFLLSAVAFLYACASPSAAVRAESIRAVELLPIDLDARNPGRRDFGRLTLLSAFELRARDPRFGGWSGLAIGADGKLYAISDRGHWFSARMRFDAEQKLIGLTDWEFAELLSPSGNPVAHPFADAESLARAADGSFLVGFEQVHRIWRYAPPPATFSSLPTALAMPPALANAPRNGGPECLTVLPQGTILTITEQFANGDGTLKGWLLEGNRHHELSYRANDGFAVTDCAALKNGDVVVLERRFLLGLFAARLTLVRAERIRREEKLMGEELLTLQAPFAVDNFEGVAVQDTSAGGATLYMISDDNYHPLQRTLLLQFRLAR